MLTAAAPDSADIWCAADADERVWAAIRQATLDAAAVAGAAATGPAELPGIGRAATCTDVWTEGRLIVADLNVHQHGAELEGVWVPVQIRSETGAVFRVGVSPASRSEAIALASSSVPSRVIAALGHLDDSSRRRLVAGWLATHAGRTAAAARTLWAQHLAQDWTDSDPQFAVDVAVGLAWKSCRLARLADAVNLDDGTSRRLAWDLVTGAWPEDEDAPSVVELRRVVAAALAEPAARTLAMVNRCG